MSEGKTEKKEVYVCGTCENVIQNLDSLRHHLIFTHGCNKLTGKNRFPTCNCGTTYDNRSLWNHHACPGKAEIMKTLFNKMVEKDKNCYRTEVASVTKRAPYKTTPSKSPAAKKASPSKQNDTSAKTKKKENKKKDSKKKKETKKDKKKDTKKKKTSEDSTIDIDSSESETLESSSSEGSTESTSDISSSEEETPSKKRKGAVMNRQADKRSKPVVSEEHERQWKIMKAYSEPFQFGDPDQTISRQSMSDLEIFERPGCISFRKTYSQLHNPFHGFAKREILKFEKGDSRMFICRDTNSPDSITSAVNIVNELTPRVIKLWEEDKDLKDGIMSSTPYFWIDSIVLPSGNMVGVYTNDNTLTRVPPRDMVCVSCLPFNVVISQGFLDLLIKYEDSMVPLSKDNNSWKGFALKGYSPSYKDLYKPEEMDKIWQKEHSISGTQSYEADLQHTDMMVHFKYYLSQLKKSIPGIFHRIQVLGLEAGGKVTRHSNKPIPTDLDAGKLILRFHAPLVTNDNVKVRVWTLEGELIEIKMEVGFIYLLDNRKPHEVVNEGATTRHHLIFDVVLDPAFEPILEHSFQISTPLADFNEKFQAWKEATEFAEIRFEENEEEMKLGEQKRIEKESAKKEEKEAKKSEGKEKEAVLKNDENEMDVESVNTTHHSENLFSPVKKNNNNMEDDNDEVNEVSEKKKAKLDSNSSISISDRFGNDSDESDEKDNSNYKLGKRANSNNATKVESTKKNKVVDDSYQKAVDAKLQEIVTTIDSDDEEKGEREEKPKGDGFVSGDLDEFLEHYDLTQFEEAFRKNRLAEKVSTFHLLGKQDLIDMGLTAEDILKWKKFNLSL